MDDHEIHDRSAEIGKTPDPAEQELTNNVGVAMVKYMRYMRKQPGYANLPSIQANLETWPDPKFKGGTSFTFSICHKTPEEP